LQLEGAQLVARQNQTLMQMVGLRGELTTLDPVSSESQSARISAAIDDLLRNAKSSDDAKLAIILGRSWGRASAADPQDKLLSRFAAFNNAIDSLLALSRESARSYRLNLDPNLDAALDMMANRLPALIDTLAKQNHVIQWDVNSMTGFVVSTPTSFDESIPALHAGVDQLVEQLIALDTSQGSPTRTQETKVNTADPSPASLHNELEELMIGIMLQQDAMDQVKDAKGIAKTTARQALNTSAMKNVAQGQALFVDSAAAVQSILNARITSLYKGRTQLIWTLIGSGFLIGYLLYAFYIGIH